MELKHVILRRLEGPELGSRTRGPGTLSTEAEPAPAKVAIELETLTAAKAAEVARKKDVEAVALVVPLKLIAPLKGNGGANVAAAGVTWGVQAVGADTSPFTGDGVTVAVLDTGIDATHPAFAGVNLVKKNFTTEQDTDLHGHGTHCAGTIFGRAVGGTRIGVAPGVKTAVIGKVIGEGGGSSDTLLEAIEWALQNGANVISMSLGIDFPGLVEELRQRGVPVELATSMALEGYRDNILLFGKLASLVQARAAFGQPALIVAAAGNESRRDEDANFVIAVSPPAAGEGIVSVAALGQGPQGFTVAPFSNTKARLSGPGVNVSSAKAGGGLTSMSGTSMATPHVAGVAALWAEKLQKSNQFASQRFVDRLVGSGTMEKLKSGFDPVDVGVGMVRAPQD
jgi:subtilisin family serine protease